MKMLAATLVDSAPLAPMIRCIATAMPRTTNCITPIWYSTANSDAMKITIGST